MGRILANSTSGSYIAAEPLNRFGAAALENRECPGP
jgi:hypothetical protein